MYRTIEVQQSGSIATVSLNRPEVRNAFNEEMIAELTEAFRSLRTASGVRAVVLRGNGPSFSAGADIHWMHASLEFTREENIADAGRMSDMLAVIDEFPKPVICRAHGAVLGGGIGLVAVCDIAVVAQGTVFGFTEAKLGIIPAVISRYVVPKIGTSWARALYLTAERFGPELAFQMGLVHWIAGTADVDRVVDEKVVQLLSSGPEAVREAKSLIAGVVSRSESELRDYTAERIAALRAGPEGQEGLQAFLEKRKASWLQP